MDLKLLDDRLATTEEPPFRAHQVWEWARAGRDLLRRDDEPSARAARAARRRGAVLVAAARGRGAGVGWHREGALPHARRPPGGGGADALSRWPPLAVRVEPVRLPPDLHVLRDRDDALRAQPHGLRDPRPGPALPPQGAREPRRLHGHGRAAHEPRQRAGRLRAPPGRGDRPLQRRRVHGGLDPGHRPDGRGGAAGAAGAVSARRGRAAPLRAHARERPLPAVRRARRLHAMARAAPARRVRRVPDARGRERPLRAGGGARGRAPAAARVQGEPDPVQPDRLGLHRVRPRRDRRVQVRPRGAGRPDHRAAHPRPRHRGGVWAARRPRRATSRRGSGPAPPRSTR